MVLPPEPKTQNLTATLCSTEHVSAFTNAPNGELGDKSRAYKPTRPCLSPEAVLERYELHKYNSALVLSEDNSEGEL